MRLASIHELPRETVRKGRLTTPERIIVNVRQEEIRICLVNYDSDRMALSKHLCPLYIEWTTNRRRQQVRLLPSMTCVQQPCSNLGECPEMSRKSTLGRIREFAGHLQY